jgi:hypothetical protein
MPCLATAVVVVANLDRETNAELVELMRDNKSHIIACIIIKVSTSLALDKIMDAVESSAGQEVCDVLLAYRLSM